MKRIIFILVLCTLLLLCAACEEKKKNTGGGEPSGSATVTITISAYGGGDTDGAEVVLKSKSSGKSITEVAYDGEATFEEVSYGTYTLTVTFDGFKTYSNDLDIRKVSLNIPVLLIGNDTSVDVATVNITLIPNSGNVAGAEVKLMNNSYSNVVYQTFALNNNISFKDVVYGTYTLAVNHGGFQSFTNNSVSVNQATVSVSAALTATGGGGGGDLDQLLYNDYVVWVGFDDDDEDEEWYGWYVDVVVNNYTGSGVPSVTLSINNQNISWDDEDYYDDGYGYCEAWGLNHSFFKYGATLSMKLTVNGVSRTGNLKLTNPVTITTKTKFNNTQNYKIDWTTSANPTVHVFAYDWWDKNENEGGWDNKYLQGSARSYTLPANTIPSNWYEGYFGIHAVNYVASNDVTFLSEMADWIDQSKGSPVVRDKKQVKSGNSHDKNKFARTHRLSK